MIQTYLSTATVPVLDGQGQGVAFSPNATRFVDRFEDFVYAAANSLAQIATGSRHTCLLPPEGGVKCWGKNFFGQLGDGTTINRPTPVDVVSLISGVVAIAAGGAHTCAITTAGGVKCWGYDVLPNAIQGGFITNDLFIEIALPQFSVESRPAGLFDAIRVS